MEPVSHPDEGTAERARRRRLAAIAVGAVLGIAVVAAVVLWWRRGGARRAVTAIAEEGAVRLADALVDEIFAA